MAKGEAARTNQLMDQQRVDQTQMNRNLTNQFLTERNDAQNRNLVERQNIQAGYQDYATNGGISQDSISRLRALYGPSVAGNGSGGSGGGPSGSGYDYMGQTAPIMQGWQKLAGGADMGLLRQNQGTYAEISGAGGGYSPEQLASLRSQINSIRGVQFDPELEQKIRGNVDLAMEMGRTGGLSADDIARMRDKGYEEFATTGGWTPEREAMTRARATSGIPSTYEAMKRGIAQGNRVQGGSGPGDFARARVLARDQAASATEASRNAELGIMEAINAGRQYGITGRANQETALQNLLSSNRIAGMSIGGEQGLGLGNALYNARMGSLMNALTQERGLGQDIIGNRLAASGQSDSAEQNAQGLDLNYRSTGLTGWQNTVDSQAANAAREAALAQSAANSANAYNLSERKFGADIEQYINDAMNSGRLSGLSGLSNLYGSNPGEVNALNQMIMQNQAQGSGENQSNLGLRAQYNPNISGWDRAQQVVGMLGSLAGSAAPVMGGPAGQSAGATRSAMSSPNPTYQQNMGGFLNNAGFGSSPTSYSSRTSGVLPTSYMYGGRQ